MKGNKFDTIEVYQLGQVGDSEILEKGKEYLLFLGLQGDENENKFYIMGGGIQGAFMNDSGKVVNKDSIMKSDLQNRKIINKSETKSELKSETEFESLPKFIKGK